MSQFSNAGRYWPPALTLLALSLAGLARADDETIEIARIGGSVSDGAQFGSFLEPSINSVGRVVFNARLTGPGTDAATNSGIYRALVTDVNLPVLGGVQEVLRESTTLDAGGLVFNPRDLFLSRVYLKDPNLPEGLAVPVSGDFGRIALQLPVLGTLANGNTTIVIEEPGGAPGDNFDLAAAEGEDVPNGDGRFGDLGGFNLFGIGSSGEVGFFAALNNTSLGSANNTAIYRYSENLGAVEIVREGDIVGGGTLSGVFSPQMNNLGGMVFLGSLGDAALSADSAVYRVASSGSAKALIAREGDAAPSGDGEFAVFSQLRINDHGNIAFSALLLNTDGLPETPFEGNGSFDNSALYIDVAGGSTTEIVREGNLTPGGNMRFGAFADPVNGDMPRLAFNDSNELAFRVDLFDETEAQARGIFVASPDGIIEIARTGDSYDDGVLRAFEHPALNNSGAVAFKAELQVGTVDGEEGPSPLLRTLLMVADGSDRATVAREGDIINGEVVFDIVFNNDPNGQVNGFSDAGLVAYEVIYESGLHAINVWAPLLTLRRPFQPPDEPMAWDQRDNWRFGITPGLAHEVALNGETGGTVLGPSIDTTVKALRLGEGGALQLLLGAGALGTVQGLGIGENGTVQGGGALHGPLTNRGQVVVSPGLALHMSGSVLNLGEIAVGEGGTLFLDGSYQGDGSITGPGDTHFAGLLSPGNSPALLSIEGDATLAASSTSLFEIAGLTRGSEYDSLQVGGTLTLGGTLSVALREGFVPGVGASFLLMEGGLIEGSFAAISLPEVAGLRFLLTQDASRVRLQVQAVPLPAALWMTLSACGVLAGLRRRPSFCMG